MIRLRLGRTSLLMFAPNHFLLNLVKEKHNRVQVIYEYFDIVSDFLVGHEVISPSSGGPDRRNPQTQVHLIEAGIRPVFDAIRPAGRMSVGFDTWSDGGIRHDHH